MARPSEDMSLWGFSARSALPLSNVTEQTQPQPQWLPPHVMAPPPQQQQQHHQQQQHQQHEQLEQHEQQQHQQQHQHEQQRARRALASQSLKELGIRACGTCVKAKVKCVPNPENPMAACQRCQRLLKECLPSAANQQKPVKRTRVAQLEKKLNSIVTLLASQGVQQNLSDMNNERQPVSSSSSSEPSVSMTPSSLDTSSPDVDESVASPIDFNFDASEAESLLWEFRTSMAWQFPFVVIPPQKSSLELRQERPFLWKAVMTAASHRYGMRQIELGKRLTEEFITQLLLQAKKSLDILQGLLVHLAWYHYHFIVNPQVTNLIYLSKALVTNLGLQWRPAVKDKRGAFLEALNGTPNAAQATLPETNSCFLDEWRALAGVFYATSIVTSRCQKLEPFHHTPYLKECCESLAVIKEYENDVLLMYLVKLQNIALNIDQSFKEPVFLQLNKSPVQMHMSMLQQELESFKSSLPADLQKNAIIVANYQIAEISLYEASLYVDQCQGLDKLQRINLMYECLVRTKNFFATQFAPERAISSSLSFVSWTQFGHAIIVGFKLCFLTAEGWDQNYARAQLNLCHILDSQIEKIEGIINSQAHHIDQTQGLDDQTESFADSFIFSRYIQQIRQVKLMYENQVNGEIYGLAASDFNPSLVTNILQRDDLSSLFWPFVRNN